MLKILRQRLQNTFLPELYSHSHNTSIREGDVQCRMSYMRSQHSYHISVIKLLHCLESNTKHNQWEGTGNPHCVMQG